jgi:hypothetical protein
MEYLNPLMLTDKELEMLSSMIRSFKLDLSTEEALLIQLGKKKHPVLDLTYKIAVCWEDRLAALNSPNLWPVEPEPEPTKVSG